MPFCSNKTQGGVVCHTRRSVANGQVILILQGMVFYAGEIYANKATFSDQCGLLAVELQCFPVIRYQSDKTKWRENKCRS